MCGIFFSALFVNQPGSSDGFQDLARRLQAANAARGPDTQRHHRTNLQTLSGNGDGQPYLALEFFASELQLRGNKPVVPPHERDGDVLCWNGEIFEGMDISPKDNDGTNLFAAIRLQRTEEEIVDLFGSLEGPYAFVFYCAISERVFFAIDPLGRRSLLIHKPTSTNPYFLLSSVSVGSSTQYEIEELPTDSIFCLDIQRLSSSTDIVGDFESCLSALPRRREHLSIVSPLPYAGHITVNKSLPPENPLIHRLDELPGALLLAVEDFIRHLDKSMMLRVQDVPHVSGFDNQARVAILFSGGIDSTVLTYLAHRHLPIDEPIDLLNVAFENRRRIQRQGIPSKSRKAKSKTCSDATVGPSCSDEQQNSFSYLVPDRVTGLQELEELRRLCPGRTWNFIEVNVPFEESQAMRPIVETLMWPRRTVMDLSLAMALYFASRGTGKVNRRAENPEGETYTSRARVLLSGLGSDELLGGYYRHRTAFGAGGWEAVIDELQLELDRIPTRNLGRDDRVISSHGKESRHPFLSLTVVSFLAQLPVHFKVDPRLEVGVGDKMLLRLAAKKLGLVEASKQKKRAMQFGSHSARMEGGEGDKKGDLLLP